MGFRFRKRLKILPGLWLNVSKGGVSTSVGVKGLTVNLKDGKTRTTASIPGTGISYSETASEKPGAPAGNPVAGVIFVFLAIALLAFVLL